MKALEKTLAVIALLILLSQTVRHAYMLWFEPRGSVLDKFNQPAKKQIEAAKSLDELVRLYEPVRKQADEARQQRRNAGGQEQIPYSEQVNQEPYKSETELREAIVDWEAKAKEIHGIRFYWVVGLVFFVLGSLIYKKWNRWLGLVLLIAAFCEFVYWTSPTFFGPVQEYDRLLRNKLLLSVVTLVLLLIIIRLNGIFADQKPLSPGS
jgi:hypothetical protein